MVSRASIILALHTALAPLDGVHAAWLEGADAAGRADAFSDLDLWVDADASLVDKVFRVLCAVLQTYGPLDVDEAQPHGDPQVRQRFLRSSGLSPFWFLDVCVQVHGRSVTFGPHDPVLLLFDRSGVIQTDPLLPEQDMQEAMAMLAARRWRWVLVDKELRRGHRLEALAYYQREVLAPLVQLIRLKHVPGKRAYGLKHLYVDLPPDVSARLEGLYGYTRLEDIALGLEQAGVWMDDLLETPH